MSRKLEHRTPARRASFFTLSRSTGAEVQMPDDSEGKDLQEELELLTARYGWDAVRRYVRKSQKKKRPGGRRGRPLLGDEAALSAMADLLYLKKVKSQLKAAAAVADGLEGASPQAIIHRLCRKFGVSQKQLMAEAARRRQPRFAVEAHHEPGPVRAPSPLSAPPPFLMWLEESVKAMEATKQRHEEAFKALEEAAKAIERRYEETVKSASELERVHRDQMALPRAFAEFEKQLRIDQERLRRAALRPDWESLFGRG